MAERRCCCNCKYCKRVDKGTHVENFCAYDNRYIGYMDTFERWCKRWVKDRTWDGDGNA